MASELPASPLSVVLVSWTMTWPVAPSVMSHVTVVLPAWGNPDVAT